MDRDILDIARESIKEHEGFSDKVYKCPAGFDTIGYGFRLSTLEYYGIKLTKPLSVELADHILDYFIEKIYKYLEVKFPWVDGLPDNAIAIMIEMTFQLGANGFYGFTNAIKYLKQHNFKNAAKEMLDSKWARKDSPNRAKEMAEIIRKLADESG